MPVPPTAARLGEGDDATPAVRRVYRVGGSVFRVSMNRLESGAEYLKEGRWVWTPIPSSSIIDHPQAIELGREDLAALLSGPPARPAARGVRR